MVLGMFTKEYSGDGYVRQFCILSEIESDPKLFRLGLKTFCFICLSKELKSLGALYIAR